MADPDVVVRLLAAIDERERWASRALPGPWHRGAFRSGWQIEGTGDPYGVAHIPDWGDGAEPTARHIMANDPDSVLRLCQSHRDIVAMYQRAAAELSNAANARWSDGADDRAAAREVRWGHEVHALLSVVGALARGYGVEDGETK